MAIVNTCCCGCSLTTGTTIAGIISTLEALMFLMYGIICFRGDHPEFCVNTDGSDCRPPTTSPTPRRYYESEEEKLIKPTESPPTYENARLMRNFGIYVTLEGSVILLASVCLFWGIIKQRRTLLLPWLIARGMWLGIEFLGCVILLVMGYKYREALSNLIFMFVMVYLYIVVISYYQTRMEGSCTGGQIMIISTDAALTSYRPPQDADNPTAIIPHTVGWITHPYASFTGPLPTSYPAPQNSASPPNQDKPYGFPFPQSLPPIANTSSSDHQNT